MQHQDNEYAHRQIIEQGSNNRVLQIADMTTFLARLLFKMTQMSCGFANSYAASQNKLHISVIQKEKSYNTEINKEFPMK